VQTAEVLDGALLIEGDVAQRDRVARARAGVFVTVDAGRGRQQR